MHFTPHLPISMSRIDRLGSRFGHGRGGRAPVLALGLICLSLSGMPVRAQVESFLLKPGSKVGPASKVKATNCVTNPADGSMTCDTKIENAPGDTPAKPQYSPFKN
jgi:hypothetical protein